MKGRKLNYLDGIKLLQKNNENKIIISGEEPYLIRDLLNRIRENNKLNFKDLNYDFIDGKDISYNGLFEICETLPFMDEKRLVIVDNLSLSRNNVSKIDSFLTALSEYLKDFPRETILVLVSYQKAFKGKFIKNSRECTVHIEVDKLNRNQLKNFILKKLKIHQISMNNEAMEYFINNTLYFEKELDINLYDVENEVNKIIHSNLPKIGIAEVEEILISSAEANIFKLTDAIGENHKQKILTSFFKLIRSDMDIVKIYYMMNRTIRNLFYIKWGQRKQVSFIKINESLKLSPYEFKKLQNYIENWKLKELQNIMHEAYRSEVKMKRSFDTIENIIRNYVMFICSS